MHSSLTKRRLSFAKWVYGGVVCSCLLILAVLWFSFIQSIEERNERAALYARMIEGTITRTFEGIEISLVSLSDDLVDGDPKQLSKVRERSLKILKFAPQLRQIVIIKGQETILDTQRTSSVNINLNILGFHTSRKSHYSLGLIIGNTLKGRFLPLEGTFPEETSRRELIPIGFESTNHAGERLLIIAAFNPSYIHRYIANLNLEKRDSVYLTDLFGVSLLQKGLYGPNRQHVLPHLENILAKDADEGRADNFYYDTLPTSTTATRLLTKYPLAVSIVVSHQGSLILWLEQKRNLLLVLFSAVFTLITGALLLLRNGQKALVMQEEVQLLSKVVEHSPTIIVITDPKGNIEYVNPFFEQVTGYYKEEVVGRNPRLLKSGKTSDKEYIEMWRVLTAGQTWHGEFHNKHKNGSLYWERSSIGPLINEAGEITHYIALKQPITEEKKAQEKLRLASNVFSVASEGIMVTDQFNQIQMVNRSFELITGYKEDEVLGKTPALLKSNMHSPDFYAQIFTKLDKDHTWEGEIWNKRKNGELYPQWLMISSRIDLEGKLEGYVALLSDITQRKHDEAVIIHQANYDSLTELPNRHLFDDRLKQALIFSERSRTKTALLYVDLDRFKYVNDTFGHYAGDLLLKQVSERLTSCVRKTDTVARLGGDEFAIIIQEMSNISTIEKVAKSALISLAKPFLLEGNEAYISCSIGIAIYPENGLTKESLILNADNAMYKAKQKGRNTHEYFNQSLSEDSKQRSMLEQDIYKALKEDEFYLLYQPIWSTDGQQIESVEALIRRAHPERGIIYPLEFIPLAEESALIHSIGEWVIHEACVFAKRLSISALLAPKVSINVSGSQFLRNNIVDMLTQELAENKLDGAALIIEITESILLLDQEKIYSQLETLVSKGIDIAVDDFGTGYSSLSYLKKYPVQRLKIDKSFIDDLEESKEDQALVAGILSLASSLSLKTVVEGVESQGQLDLLRQYGSPMIQGYLLAKPMSEDMLVTLLTEQASKNSSSIPD